MGEVIEEINPILRGWVNYGHRKKDDQGVLEMIHAMTTFILGISLVGEIAAPSKHAIYVSLR